MDRRGTAVAALFLFYFVANVSNGSLIGMLPDLTDEAQNNSSAVEKAVSPSPSPESLVMKPDLKVENPEKSGNGAAKLDPEVPNRTVSVPTPAQSMAGFSQKPESLGEMGSASPPRKSFTDSGQNANLNDSKDAGKINLAKEGEGNKKNTSDDRSESPDNRIKGGVGKNEDKTDSEAESLESCKGLPSCDDHNSLIACIKGSDRSGELVVLIENKEDEPININISTTLVKSGKLIFSSGHGDCVLLVDPLVPKQNFLHLLSYDKLLTPFKGAYFLIATVIIFAGTWACCKFKKRTRDLDGIPYQELEMGNPDSSGSTGVETAECWHEEWGDDWDEEHAVKSPSLRISANGLTARSSNKDGWDD